jgi:hypothetical protein
MGYCIAGMLGMFGSLAVTFCVYWMVRHRESAPKKDLIPVSPEVLLSAEVKNELEHEVQSIQQVMGELLEQVHRKVRHLDAKEAQLMSLVQQAEVRMKELTDLLQRVSLEQKEASLKKTADELFLDAVSEAEPLPMGGAAHDQKIFELTQQGMSLVEIAKTLGVGTGEVSLRLGLLQRRTN